MYSKNQITLIPCIYILSTECPEGNYGLNCSKMCSGHCAGPTFGCDHVDGSCDDGCDAGYIAPLCTEGNFKEEHRFFLGCTLFLKS